MTHAVTITGLEMWTSPSASGSHDIEVVATVMDSATMNDGSVVTDSADGGTTGSVTFDPGTGVVLDHSSDTAGVFLQGTSGNDTLIGGSGNDTLIGGSGDNTLIGGSGNDILVGGSGNNIFIGGPGNDTLIGGSGADTFVWQFGDQGAKGSPAQDIVRNFDTAKDMLDVHDLLQDYKGDLANYLHFANSGSDTIVYISTSGGFLNNNHNVNNPNYSQSGVDQRIVLQGIDLIGGSTTDQDVINHLIQNGNLKVDA
jgi:Ca2+-binding RTX toxin-like protein